MKFLDIEEICCVFQKFKKIALIAKKLRSLSGVALLIDVLKFFWSKVDKKQQPLAEVLNI